MISRYALNPALARKIAGNVETASFFSSTSHTLPKTQSTMFTDIFPVRLSESLRKIFDPTPFSPAVISMIPAADEIEFGFLCPEEYAQLQKYKLPKRRSEFLSGRLCAKLAVSRYLEESLRIRPGMEQIEICNNENGRPFLCLHPEQPFAVPEISISHSSGYAAAIAARHRCGIDIQKQDKSLIKVQEKFCADREYTLLRKSIREGDKLRRLALLWSAKEAIQKTFSIEKGVISFSSIRLQRGEETAGGCTIFSFLLPPKSSLSTKENIIKVVAVTLADYAIAVSISGDKSDA
jgi:4'-phosphopantetheinyl transferase EntD